MYLEANIHPAPLRKGFAIAVEDRMVHVDHDLFTGQVEVWAYPKGGAESHTFTEMEDAFRYLETGEINVTNEKSPA